MEERKVNVSIGKAGGNASKNAMTYKVNLPSKWMNELGVTSENRTVNLCFIPEEKQIIVQFEDNIKNKSG